MGYITVSEAARKWGISDRRVRLLCSQDRIEGVIHKGRKYLIPIDAQKPVDERTRKSKANPAPDLNVFDHSDQLKEKIARKLKLSKAQKQKLLDEFLLEFTYNSNAIDGNPLSLKEVGQVFNGNTIARKPLKDHLDIIGTRDAFLYIKDLSDQKVPLSENVVKNIHSLVLIQNAKQKGHYRSRSLAVQDPYIEQVQPYLIKSKMNDLIFENNRRRKKMPSLERIARFHMDFKALHPFCDANGRTNRLILNLELMEDGYPPIDIRFSDRKKYFEAFDSYYRDGDANPMINLIVKYVEEAMQKLLADSAPEAAPAPRISEPANPQRQFVNTSMYHNNPVRYEEAAKPAA